MDRGNEAAGRDQEMRGPRMTSVLILHEAGQDYRAYFDRLYREYEHTPIGDSLAGVAYLVGTYGETDPFEIYYERVRSFHDGVLLGLRVAKSELGDQYESLFSQEMMLLDTEGWKRFFKHRTGDQRNAAADYFIDSAKDGLDIMGEYEDLAGAFANELPTFDPADNLLPHGFGYMMNVIASMRAVQLEASFPGSKHAYRPLED